MPNWCSNSVTFSGRNVSLAKKMFDDLVDKYDAGDGSGVKPDMIPDRQDGPNPYMFEFRQNGDGTLDDVSYIYDTKWSPNIDDVQTIAKTLDCDFKMYYEEIGVGIYGYAQMVNGLFQEIDLDDTDTDQVEYDEDLDSYTFRDLEYESQYDCYEILLEEKLKANNII